MKSYFKFLSRNKLYTAIEAFGLSVALGFVVILGAYAMMEYSVGKGNEKAKEIYAVGSGDYLGMTWGTAQEFFPSIPEIKEWTRVATANNIPGFMVGETFFKADAYCVDPNFFEFFGYDVRGCRRDRVLTSENEAIVSESFAAKAFGNGDAIGKTLKYDTITFRITGVMPDFGKSDIFEPYDVMVSMKYAEKLTAKMDNFGETVPFIRLDKDADPAKVSDKLLDKYVDYWKDFEYSRENDGKFLWGSTIVRLDKLYFSTISNWKFRQGDKKLVDLLLAVALVLLVCAIFNYINLTVAQAGKRAKEMATRRLLGESVWGVMVRYFKESALFTSACFIIGLLLALCLLPVFNDMLKTQISLPVSLLVLLVTVAALLVISTVCGIIPAMVVSRFNPIDVVKGSLRIKNKMWFSKLFITAQGVVSTVLIAVGLTMTLQMHHLYTLSYGYNKEDVIIAYTNDVGYSLDKQMVLANRLKALPEVVEAAPGGGTPLQCGADGVHDVNDKVVSWVAMCRLDSTAMKMLGIKVIEQYCEPTEGKVWVSESGKRFWGVSAKKPYFGVNNGKPEYECCGVIADYRSGTALPNAMDKCYNGIMVAPHDGYFYTMLIKTRGDHDKALATVKNTCSMVTKEVRGMPLEMNCKYIDDILSDGLKTQRNTMSLVLTFMLVSILISALGMFAMSVYYGEQQRKQIALRKVMGATVASAVWTLSRRFLVMSLVAIVLAMPLSIKAMRHYLQDFTYQIPMPWWVLAAAALFTLVISFLSIISRTLKVATANPVESIKTE
ncbi:MAG: FtsX-like permease family protein [Prevotella sp.]|nr:FtsX-like permease family protein [Prevotella sp.]